MPLCKIKAAFIAAYFKLSTKESLNFKRMFIHMFHFLSQKLSSTLTKVSLICLLSSFHATANIITQEVLKTDNAINNEYDLSMFEILPINSDTNVGYSQEIQTIVTLLDAGNYDQALEYIEQNTANLSTDPIIQELQGAALAKKGDINRAVDIFKKIRKSHPLQYTALTKLADIYLFQGKLNKAQELFEESAKIAPTFRFNHQRLGMLYETQGLKQNAVDAYEKGLIGTPPEYLGIKIKLAGLLTDMGQSMRAISLLSPFDDSSELKLGYSGHFILGLSYLNEKSFEQAKKQFDLAANIQPNAIGPLYGYAKMHRANKQYNKALQLYKKAVDIQPKLVSLRLDLADTYLIMGKEVNAIEELNTARDIANLKWPITELIIQALTNRQRYSEAFDETLALYSAKPDNLYLKRLGTLAQKMPDKKFVISTLTKLSLEAPEPAEVFYIMGLFFSYHQNYADGLDAINESLQIAPDVTKYLKTKSLILLRLGQKKQALAAVEQMQDNKDSDPENFYMGTIFEINEKYISAKRLYKKALEASPDNIIILNNLAWVEQKSGDLANAIITAEKAYRLNQSNSTILDTYGWILFLNTEYEKASTILSEAVNVENPDPNTLYRLARVEVARSEYQIAKKHLQLALSNTTSFDSKVAAISLLTTLTND
jgi:tetratricopeptide (TPR) repeat protein